MQELLTLNCVPHLTKTISQNKNPPDIAIGWGLPTSDRGRWSVAGVLRSAADVLRGGLVDLGDGSSGIGARVGPIGVDVHGMPLFLAVVMRCPPQRRSSTSIHT